MNREFKRKIDTIIEQAVESQSGCKRIGSFVQRDKSSVSIEFSNGSYGAIDHIWKENSSEIKKRVRSKPRILAREKEMQIENTFQKIKAEIKQKIQLELQNEKDKIRYLLSGREFLLFGEYITE